MLLSNSLVHKMLLLPKLFQASYKQIHGKTVSRNTYRELKKVPVFICLSLFSFFVSVSPFLPPLVPPFLPPFFETGIVLCLSGLHLYTYTRILDILVSLISLYALSMIFSKRVLQELWCKCVLGDWTLLISAEVLSSKSSSVALQHRIKAVPESV